MPGQSRLTGCRISVWYPVMSSTQQVSPPQPVPWVSEPYSGAFWFLQEHWRKTVRRRSGARKTHAEEGEEVSDAEGGEKGQ